MKLIKLRFKIILASLLGVVLLMLFKTHGCSHKIPKVALSSKDREEISYNSKSHQLTITTAKGTTQEYSRNPDIHIQKNGNVVVQRHVWGLEHDFVAGFGYSDTGRVVVGCNLFYFYKLDLVPMLAFVPNSNGRSFIKPYIATSYNVYSNTSLFVGTNPFNIQGLDFIGGITFKW